MNSKVNICAVILIFCTLTHGIRRDFPWSISLTVSDAPGSEYEGQVEVLTVFEHGIQHATIFPSTRYNQGQTYTFPMLLMSSGHLDALYIRTRGFCPLGLLPHDVLRLSHVNLISKWNNTAYSKHLGDVAIKDACQTAKTQGTSITGFSESQASSCVLENGQIYENGDQFDMGCTGRCKCENGSIVCVDMCGVATWDPDEKCRYVHVPGQCCDRVVCETEEKLTCEEPTIANVDSGDGKKTVAVRRYPWSVMYCLDEACKQIHGGIILSQRHILTLAPDLSTHSHLLVSAGQYFVDQLNTSYFSTLQITNVTAHPDFVNTDSLIADSAVRLQLIEFKESFTFSKTLQAANLPFDTDHCKELSKNDCPLMTVGWDLTDPSELDIRQWFLHADKSKKDENMCVPQTTGRPRVRGPRRRGEKRDCVGGLIRDDCTGPLGGVAVASSAKVDFVIGLTDPDAALSFCDHPGTADVLPLCKYLDWIQQSVEPDY